MANKHNLTVRVTPEVRNRIRSLAETALTNESIWVRQAVDAALRQCEVDNSTVVSFRSNKLRDQRICLRLQYDDRLLLVERAAARGMQPATYAAVLMRAHLRDLAPLPAAELRGLTRSVAELSAIGRNLNQIALAINRSEDVHLPGRQEVFAMLKICEALRDFTKDLIKANNQSWKVGHAQSLLGAAAGKPFLEIRSLGRQGPGRRDHITRSELEIMRRTLNRDPEVMVKVISKGAQDLKAIEKHLQHIGREGEIDMIDDQGQAIRDPDAVTGRGLGRRVVALSVSATHAGRWKKRQRLRARVSMNWPNLCCTGLNIFISRHCINLIETIS